MPSEFYRKEIHDIVKKYFPLDNKKYQSMISELAEYVDDEVSNYMYDSYGDDL